ncbi:Na+/H+ antiporter [Paradevosia shaoguanensis]|uniref:Na+/H+ antiporter n=1 Tax=Paradevosia shaoguanensis TaxID=1335043 RepID=UPI00193124D8|nr:Na+/H+ antiporter [Paradevosia shaoguanensis]
MFSQLLIVVIGAIAISIFAERRGIQAPLLIVALGLIASYIPGLPRLELEPEVILTIVLPPLLFSAANEFSFTSFVRRLGSIVNLGVILVVVTTFAVGWIAFSVGPLLSLPAALVLGAVISPPDAVSAVAIARQLHLPGRLMTVLKGESLINDAAALTLFSLTTAAVTGAHLATDNVALFFLYRAVVGAIFGVALGALVHRIRSSVSSSSLATVLTVIVPFAAYRVAEELGASGVIAVVAAGFSLGYNAAEADYSERIQEREFWKTINALLDAFVFAYIGLQLRFVVEDTIAAGYDFWQVFALSSLVLLAVIAVRIAWVVSSGYLSHLRDTRIRARPPRGGTRRRLPPEPFTWKENLVVGWCGMRGVVTLAAAAGIPYVTLAGAPFPERPVIQTVAFLVTIGTLLLQGLTLPYLIKRLDLVDPNEARETKRQLALSREISHKAAHEVIDRFAALHTSEEGRKIAQIMIERMRLENTQAKVAKSHMRGPAMIELGQEVLMARRAALIAARDARQLDDEFLRETLEQLDLQQAVLDNWARNEAEGPI